jgi:dimethylhistidine N-methyltransferase
LRVRDIPASGDAVLAEVLRGLRLHPKALPPKLFYDARGSALFNAICATHAYYLTRTEEAILSEHAADIALHVGESAVLIEPGAGDLRKVRLLLSALQPKTYIGFDISGEPLMRAATALARQHPTLPVYAVHGDYEPNGIAPDEWSEASRRVVFFPGSSIGNFDPAQARGFLARVRELTCSGGGMLVGVDFQKDKGVLDLAYNDPEGYTAAFNLNILDRINRDVGADFDLDAFSHLAFYNPEAARVEMHLVSARAQTVHIAGQEFRFAAGEAIHTENSYKYTPGGFEALARSAGFGRVTLWSDARKWFGVFFLD